MKSISLIPSLVLGYLLIPSQAGLHVVPEPTSPNSLHGAFFEPHWSSPTSPVLHRPAAKRASPAAPNGYIPTRVSCPWPLPQIRNASSLSPNETSWLSLRRSATASSLKTLLRRVSIDGFDVDAFFDTDRGGDLPNLAIAMSGGGYRGMLSGAGALSGFDARTEGSTDVGKGGVGGVLQAATYLAGISGGSWIVGSLYVQNFSTIAGILGGDAMKGVWQLNQSIFEGPSGTGKFEYYRDLRDSVKGKQDAGFATTIADFWGLSLSYQLISPDKGGPAYTFSSITNNSWFAEAQSPLPIIVAAQRPPNTLNLTLRDTVYEWNPWEMGSYDTDVGAYAPLQFVGSTFRQGQIREGGFCVNGFDNAGFIIGTSSSMFNSPFLTIRDQDDKGWLKSYIGERLEAIGQDNRDVAWWPNPFRDYGNTLSKSEDILTFFDGGMVANVPLHPLLWKERNVDVIITVDSSANINNWPNGTAMVATYQRSLSKQGDVKAANPFPRIPSPNTFVNKGLNSRPTFFGCPSEYVADVDVEDGTPLIVYLPHAPYSYMSNVSTYTMSYTNDMRDAVIANGRNVVTRGRGKMDDKWPQCLACAILLRAMQRRGIEFPKQCDNCFKSHCWDGQVDDRTPERDYEPTIKLSGAWRIHWREGLILVLVSWMSFFLL